MCQCQVAFLGPHGEIKGFDVEMMAIIATSFSTKLTYCTLELLKCDTFGYLDVQKEISLELIPLGFLLSWLLRSECWEKEVCCWLQQSATELSAQCSNQSKKSHYKWHFIEKSDITWFWQMARCILTNNQCRKHAQQIRMLLLHSTFTAIWWTKKESN